MPRLSQPSQVSGVPVRLVGAGIAIGLHAAILAAILSAPPSKIEVDLPETVEVRFVEISDEVVDAAPNENPTEEVPAEPVQEASEPVAEPVAEPQPEPIPEPEPLPEPEPEPEAIVEPPPPPPPPEPLPPPKPEPPPPPKPKPEPPKPRPQPKPAPKPQPKPQPKPVVKPQPAPSAAASAAAGPSGKESAPVPKAPSAPVDPDRPRVVGSVDYLGKRPTPEYPRISQRRGEQGRVIVRVLISPEGRVIDASVRSSSGHERLDEAALKAVRSARFKPYTENGHAYRALADIPFDFVL